nr:hypothetical protein [Tanacetum cinerariifolium]
MSTQQDIYAAGSESRLPMLNKENYVPWSSRLLWYAKSRPNGKLIHNSILNGPYVRKMFLKPGDANYEITVTETFHLQTDNELSDKELKKIEADDQAIQTILLRNKHIPEKIASNLKFLNNLQPEWSRHVTIVHQTKDLHTADYTQLYDFLKYNQKEGNAAGQNENQIRCYNCRGVEEYDLMAATTDLDEIEEVNVNCILMANLQQASTLGTQTDSAPVYNTDRSAENDHNVISEDTGVEQGGKIVEQHPVNFEETRALYESLYQNLAIEVEKVNSINYKLKETNTDMTTELARYKNQ